MASDVGENTNIGLRDSKFYCKQCVITYFNIHYYSGAVSCPVLYR